MNINIKIVIIVQNNTVNGGNAVDYKDFDRRKRVRDFQAGFYTNPMVLYVGVSLSEEQIAKIATYPWSCVITTRREAEFACQFGIAGERTCRECTERKEVPARPLNREELPILRLYGIRGMEKEADPLLAELGIVTNPNDNAVDMLQLLPELLSGLNQLTVVGYDPDQEGELPVDFLIRTLLHVLNGNVQFWGMPEKTGTDWYHKVSTIAEKKGFQIYPDDLSYVLDVYEEEQSGEIEPDAVDTFYSGNAPVILRPKEILRYRYFSVLLTNKTVYKVRPFGRLQYGRWFSNFLQLSLTEEPQWYGYLPQSLFYFKRRFEDTLVQFVRKHLYGGSDAGNQEYGPIVLRGAPGSSKTITLGALAYRVFNEKISPVVYMNNSSLLFYNGSKELDDLSELLQYIEEHNSAGTRTLLIWDCSSYRSGISNAVRLVQELRNRGRRFLLVCSAYQFSQIESKETEYLKMVEQEDTVRFISCEEQEKQVTHADRCYFIESYRDLSDGELGALKSRFREFSGIPSGKLNYWFNRLREENTVDIFDYFYRLIALLQRPLENGLTQEQQKVAQYVSDRYEEILQQKREERHLTPMMKAFLDAGFDLEDFDTAALEEEQRENVSLTNALDQFNLCIALFSQFKLSVPSDFAFDILDHFCDADYKNGIQRQVLYRVVQNIPWLYYGALDEKDNFFFRFRNPLEAEIFIGSKECGGEKIIGLICEILEIYGDVYRQNGGIDQELTKNLQELLRLVGPNTKYAPYVESEVKHRHILRHLDLLIEKLKKIVKEYRIPDEDKGFALIIVTFSREYYGRFYDDNVEETRDPDDVRQRLEKISDTASYANECIDQLDSAIRSCIRVSDRQHLQDQQDSLTVELALCTARAKELNDLLRTLTGERKRVAGELRYSDIFQRLVPIINRQPNNGYAYNVLFKAFLEAYRRESCEEAKLQYLSEIMQIVEVSNNTEILNRGANGRDELSENIVEIKTLSEKIDVSIDGVLKKTMYGENGFYLLYDRMMEENNPAAITFVCQKELDRAGIVFKPSAGDKLTDYQLMTCKYVREFMRRPENMRCILYNPYAIALLIRVSWMCYNETPLLAGHECQITRLKKDLWEDIANLCGRYFESTRGNYKRSVTARQPILILLYALSQLQITNDFAKAQEILSSLNEADFYGLARMRTPFMICDEEGKPKKYTGIVISVTDYKGYVRVVGLPEYLGGKRGIRFHKANLGKGTKMPEEQQSFSELELGIGYTGFSAYTDAGRIEKEAR